MNFEDNKGTPSKETSDTDKTVNEYDDNNIPEIDTQNLIPDEVPRKDGPGGN